MLQFSGNCIHKAAEFPLRLLYMVVFICRPVLLSLPRRGARLRPPHAGRRRIPLRLFPDSGRFRPILLHSFRRFSFCRAGVPASGLPCGEAEDPPPLVPGFRSFRPILLHSFRRFSFCRAGVPASSLPVRGGGGAPSACSRIPVVFTILSTACRYSLPRKATSPLRRSYT